MQNSQTVGNPLILKKFFIAWFWLIKFSGRAFRAGKSNSSNTTSSLAQFLNSGFAKTSACNFLHQPHQSLPVKNAKIGFPVDFDSACASLTSLSQNNVAFVF